MICNHTSDTLSAATAGLLAALVAVTLSMGPVQTVVPANASALAPTSEPSPALRRVEGGTTPVAARESEAAAVLGGGGCGEREIRVFDAAAGQYRTRTASVCWRSIL